MIHNMDKNMAQLTALLKSQSEKLVVLFENQAQRDVEVKEILKSLSVSMEKGRGLSDRVILIATKLEAVDKSLQVVEKDIVKIESEQEYMKTFNKRLIGSFFAISSTMGYFIFQMITAKVGG